MRWASLAIAGTLLCAAAPAEDEIVLPAVSAQDKTVFPKATRGQRLAVACPNIDHIASENVEVVMMFTEGQVEKGYRGFLVTEQAITPDAVHFRVPDMPDLTNQVVRVMVHYLAADGLHSCDGGRVKVL